MLYPECTRFAYSRYDVEADGCIQAEVLDIGIGRYDNTSYFLPVHGILRQHYVAIEGAYHFNKKYWNQVFLDGDVDDKLLKQLIDHSVEEVLKKFTKKMRTEYEALP